jgi:hypothetical protein
VKRWLIATLLASLLISSIVSSSLTNRESSIVISDTIEPALERIYGRIIAPDIYEEITTTELRDIVRDFTENGSRYIEAVAEVPHDEINVAARYYISQKLDELSNGRVEIELIGQYFNVVGKLPGYLPGDNPVFAVTAHYDSPEGSPGANCDGGGVAVMLTLARVMSQYEWPLDIYFMAFNGLHPHGMEYTDFMEGSEEVAIELRSRGVETLALFNIDTILYPNPGAPNDRRILMGYDITVDYTLSQYWADLTQTMSKYYGGNAIVSVPGQLQIPIWNLGDHYPFTLRDFSGVVCAFESGYATDAVYHGGGDVYNYPGYNYVLCKEVAATVGACMAYTMGRTIGEPRQINSLIIVEDERVERFYIPITTPTNVNVTCRWFGGPATFQILNPIDQIVASVAFDYSSAWEYVNLFDFPISEKGLYTLLLNNTGNDDVGFDLSYSYNTDIDNNGVLDHQEFWLDPVYFTTDQDSDGLSAADELFLRTDDENIDSDADTMDDKFEVDNGLDPTNPADGSADADDDGLTNAEEYSLGLNLFSADSDQDLMDDFWELENGLNPLFDDSMLDADGDGKTNLQEYLEETDPQMVERESIPVIWLITPLVLIAVIVGFLYLGRDSF